MELPYNVQIAGIFLINSVACLIVSKLFSEKNEKLSKILNIGCLVSLVMAPTLFLLLKK